MAHLRAGEIFAGAFRVEAPLSAGGMGAVYRVTQLGTGRPRALKLMLPELTKDPRFRERFQQEAQVGARIASEHVVEVIDAGVDQASGQPWIAMELLEGEDLDSVVEKHGALPPGKILEIFRQATHALGAAHRAGVVHRDLKPENIFLAISRRQGADFTVKVLDFGIAKIVAEARSSHTQTIGTPLWMAPEQTVAQSMITPAADIWPLGLLGFFLLTGRVFWSSAHTQSASQMQILREVAFEPIPTAMERANALGCADRLPPGFDAWFSRCVVRDVSQRYGTVDQVMAGLEKLLAAYDTRTSYPGGLPPAQAMRMETSAGAPLSAALPGTPPGVTPHGITPAGVPTTQPGTPQHIAVPPYSPSPTPAGIGARPSNPGAGTLASMGHGGTPPHVAPQDHASFANAATGIAAQTSHGAGTSGPVPYGDTAPKPRSSGALIGAAVIGVLALGGGGYAAWHMTRETPKPAPTEETTAAASAESTATSAPPPTAAPSVSTIATATAVLRDPSLAQETAPAAYRVTLSTTRGDFIVDCFRARAPNAADRFFNLVKIGYYDDVAFHRVVRGAPASFARFGIHGDPEVNNVWRGQAVMDDAPTNPNKRGTLAFARKPGGPSSGTELVFNLSDNAAMDTDKLVPFCQVNEAGLTVLDTLHAGYGDEPASHLARIEELGNKFLKEQYPSLDYIKTARLSSDIPTEDSAIAVATESAPAPTGTLTGRLPPTKPTTTTTTPTATVTATTTTTTTTTTTATATASDGPPFDRGAAMASMSFAEAGARSCARPGGPTGSTSVTVIFSPSGRAQSVSVGAPFAGTPTGACIMGAFKSCKVPAFGGPPQSASRGIRVP